MLAWKMSNRIRRKKALAKEPKKSAWQSDFKDFMNRNPSICTGYEYP